MSTIANVFYKNIAEDWQQGDIVLNIGYGGQTSDLAILATPQCDIYQDKADYFIFILSSEFKSSFKKVADSENKLTDDNLNGIEELSKNKLSAIISNLISHFNGARSQRFYYLLPFSSYDNNFGPTYLDFQRIVTVPKAELNKWKDRRAVTVADPFRSAIFTRYSSFIGRIGTPNFADEEINEILNFLNLKFRPEDFKDICDKKFTK